jgi:hypothetical protein
VGLGVIPGSRVEARGVTPRWARARRRLCASLCSFPRRVYARHCTAFPDVSEKWQLELQRVLTDSSSRHFSLSDEIDGSLPQTRAACRVGRPRYVRAIALALRGLRAVLVSSAGLERDETRRLTACALNDGVEWTAISRTY